MNHHTCCPPVSCSPRSRRRSTSVISSLSSAPAPYHFQALCSTKFPKSHGDASSIVGSQNTYVSASIAGGSSDSSGSGGGCTGANFLNSAEWDVRLANEPRGCTLTGSLVYSCAMEDVSQALILVIGPFWLTGPSKKSKSRMSDLVSPVTSVPLTHLSSLDKSSRPWNNMAQLRANGTTPG